MLFPQEMTEIELVVPEQDVVKVTGMLASKGVFQQIDSSYLIPDSEVKSAQEWRERYSQYYELERRLISAMKLLDLNEGQLKERTQTSLAELKEIRPEAEHLEQQVTELQDQLNDTQKRIDKLQGYLQQLEPGGRSGFTAGKFAGFPLCDGLVRADAAGQSETYQGQPFKNTFCAAGLETY